jgi:hypothetical protein
MRIHSYGGLKTSGEELMGMELGTSSRLVVATVLIGVIKLFLNQKRWRCLVKNPAVAKKSLKMLDRNQSFGLT